MATSLETAPHVLNDPVWAALNGTHRHVAEFTGSAARYDPEVAPFAALADPADPRSWQDLAALLGPGGRAAFAGAPPLPEGWRGGTSVAGAQLVATALRADIEPEARPLGPADVPEMMELVARAKPGPFRPRTIELGAYYGIRRGGRLIAMAGERIRPPGWTEISAVCTDEAFRGQGLATRLIRHVAAGIAGRGDTPFLHVAAGNAGAIRLYESIGFTRRRDVVFYFVEAPRA